MKRDEATRSGTGEQVVLSRGTSTRVAREVQADAPRSLWGEGTSWPEETGTDLAAELDKQRQEAIGAAREALDIAERDAKKLQKLEANSAKADISAEQLRRVLKDLGEWRLWEGLLRNSELISSTEAWQAAHDFTRIIEDMQPDDVNSDSVEPFLETIARLRKQIDFVEKHACSRGWLEIIGIYRGAAQRIRWKVAVALAAATAGMGSTGGPFIAKIMLAALTGACASSLTSAVLDEIRDRASVRSMESTPRGRVSKAQDELVRPISVLVVLLERRARSIPLEKGELEVTRTAHLVAEFRAINLGHSLAGFGWIERRRYVEAFKSVRDSLGDVLYMTISQDYGQAKRVVEQIGEAVDGLKGNAPEDTVSPVLSEPPVSKPTLPASPSQALNDLLMRHRQDPGSSPSGTEELNPLGQ